MAINNLALCDTGPDSMAILNALIDEHNAIVLNKPTILFKNNILITHTGTTAATKVYSKLIPVGTFSATDTWRFMSRVIVSLNANNKTIALKVNTTDSLAGAITIATYIPTNTTIYYKHNFWFPNSLATVGTMAAGANVSNDENTSFVSSTSSSATFNFNQNLYFMIECTLANSADSILIHEFTVVNEKSGLL